MICLKTFHFPTPDQDWNFFVSGRPEFSTKSWRSCYNSAYPFMLFRQRGLPDPFEFGSITVFCGNNGSGKSTLLNVISETLGLARTSPYNRSDFFDDYTRLCDYTLGCDVPPQSRIITSDDVFDRILDIRRLNEGVDDQRNVLLKDFVENRGDGADASLHGLSDYERWRRVWDARNKNVTGSAFVRSKLIRNVEERSNGESALCFFVDAIADGGLYLLDEPENSLSPQNQLELKYFLEDCVRGHGCQFILSTHSPFLLSLCGAKIYDLDETPVKTKKWTELESVLAYQRFFRENESRFSKPD